MRRDIPITMLRWRMKAVGMNPYQYEALSAKGKLPLEQGLRELARREAQNASGLCPKCGGGPAKWTEGDVTPTGRYRLTCTKCHHRFTKDPRFLTPRGT
jgi:hypothetical protein